MPDSPRKRELLDRAWDYVLGHGIVDLSLRPLAEAIGSSPRVLIYLFGSKEGLLRALLAHARREQQAVLDELEAQGHAELADVGERVWSWLAADEHRGLLRLWLEAYSRSAITEAGAWEGFAASTVTDWLTLLERLPTPGPPETAGARRTLLLAVLRGALLDLLATGDRARVDAAVAVHLDAVRAQGLAASS